MHYRVRGLDIRSENAAKPMSQASGYLNSWIRSREPVQKALDFGCGKLRYAGAMATICELLTLVDSEIQLSRTQKLGNESTTVRDYAKAHWSHSRTLTFKEFLKDGEKYDFALCANVLPSIPATRARATILRSISLCLKSTGSCLFVTQYTNSYFTKIRKSPNSIRHLDGWIVKGRFGNSYYGILPKQKLEKLVSRFDFSVLKSWNHGQSAYVLAQTNIS